MTAEVFQLPMFWLNAVARYVCVAGAERERVGGGDRGERKGETEARGRWRRRKREKRKEMR